ncbi:MAG: hypothetical protein OEZ10_08210 [Gammaproteobacteria bacterium]|nr:hypothetical protein [Gammaproteobacteria bacterium]
MKIASAVTLGLIAVLIFPRAQAMMKNSPKAEAGDWQAVLLPLLAVAGFIVLLVMMLK